MLLPFAEIHFALPLSRGYTYRVPDSLDMLAQAGCRALAPLGKRVATGFIVRRTNKIDFAPEKLRDILDVLDSTPLFDASRLELAQWIADYYLCGLGEVLRTMLPPGLEKESHQYVRLARAPSEEEMARLENRAPRQAEIVRALMGKEGYKVRYLAKHLQYEGVRSSLQQLMQAGWVEISQQIQEANAQTQKRFFVEITTAGRLALENENKKEANKEKGGKEADKNGKPVGRKLTAKQFEGLQLLAKRGAMLRAFFLKRSGLGGPSLQSLIQREFVRLLEREVDRNPYFFASHSQAATTDKSEMPAIMLNAEQAEAVRRVSAALTQKAFEVFLLHGITGSGKTQVYIETIRHALAQGQAAIMLVPEISLTPQAVARFQANFGNLIAVLHSHMSAGERYDAWRRVHRGEARVVIGARSAVFAPVKNLGLIVVDEEHEGSYKQADPAPRYHARDVAIVRAKMSRAVVLLGSATPSIESYTNAQRGKYTLLELPNRIDNVPLPTVRILDMMTWRKTAPDREGIFSRILLEKIGEKLAKQEQIILLQNRRGFAPLIRCLNCGFVRYCDACNIPMTYHKRGNLLRCHYCNAYERAPDVCPQCKGRDIIFKGIGTQKVELALKELFPQARVVRMDLDTTRGKLAHDRILREFGEHKYDILLGTQMIAKGLDFHKVTLVGVVSADTGLLRPDFRAGERTFQLLTQVAGRAGRRNLPGEVIVQTYSPDDVCMVCAREHDFKNFYAHEVRERQALRFPPFSRLALVQFRHRDNERIRGIAQDFAALLKKIGGPFRVFGPAPSPLERIQNEFRWQVLIKNDMEKDPSAHQTRATLHRVAQFFHKANHNRRVRMIVDVDPMSML
ncbi:MAG: primosomal protein N' [candidate division KSB1 bacterium]|nr:primosomal protein N' [candidate division KSB1 bacterium]MDZ7364914.1 primosomal protein N' [candidate division KSB1 bacterium]MDZ7403016.1 primosomal protein N' [candidate division KSB1 bacterium]